MSKGMHDIFVVIVNFISKLQQVGNKASDYWFMLSDEHKWHNYDS